MSHIKVSHFCGDSRDWHGRHPGPVVSGVSITLLVGVGVDQRAEKEGEEVDDAPEEVADGVYSPRPGLQHAALVVDVYHPRCGVYGGRGGDPMKPKYSTI